MPLLRLLVSALPALLFGECSSFIQTVKIQVPAAYVGWVFVIPARDTSGLAIQKKGDKFRVNGDGVAYVPAPYLDLKKDSRVLVYEGSREISDALRYAGSVVSVQTDATKYTYIQFYLPSPEERKIDAASHYWLEKSWTYSGGLRPRFDSLLAAGRIVFR